MLPIRRVRAFYGTRSISQLKSESRPNLHLRKLAIRVVLTPAAYDIEERKRRDIPE
jgi:hypothetical protein